MGAATNLNRTLEELEQGNWGNPGPEHTHLVQTCMSLRKKKLADFTIEDLRIMIGQNISLPILVPMAITELTKNVMAEGDFYEGDLLERVLTSDKAFWATRPDLKREVTSLWKRNKQKILQFRTSAAIIEDLKNAYADFSSR